MFHTLNPRPDLELEPSSPGAIADLLNHPHLLILTLHELDSVTHASWEGLYQQIVKYIKQNQISLVVIDRTGEPRELDANQDCAPNDLAIRDAISKVCSTVIITDDYSEYTTPQPNVVCFPYNLWLLATKNVHKYYAFDKTVYDTDLQKQQPLLCLNRNLHWHRIVVYLELIKKPWVNDVVYSFIRNLNAMDLDWLRRDLTSAELDSLESHRSKFPIVLEHERAHANPWSPMAHNGRDGSLNTNHIRCGYQNGGSSVNLPMYQTTAINFITEVSLNHGVVLTEKTAKAFMAYQIPLLLAPPGANTWLQSLGLDMFADYVPWQTWDHLTDHRHKIQLIFSWLDRVMMNPKAIVAYHTESHNRLLHNKQYFHSKEFENKLLAPLRDYSRSSSCA